MKRTRNPYAACNRCHGMFPLKYMARTKAATVCGRCAEKNAADAKRAALDAETPAPVANFLDLLDD